MLKNASCMHTSPPRRVYLDWLRGLAVLVMIEAHLFDSWTGGPDRAGRAYAWSMVFGGMGAPLFLFLAGVAVPLSAASKLRRTNEVRQAKTLVQRRGLEIFALAFLFRLQAWVLGWGPLRTLLRVDILNIMGPAIVAAGTVWGSARSCRGRVLAFGAATLAIAFSTPLVRTWAPLAWLPDPLEAYIRPAGGYSMFVFFPWAAFVMAGATLGVLLDEARTADVERRLIRSAGLAGAGLALAAFGLSYLPSPYPSSFFWTTSPAFFFLRTGVMVAAVWVAWGWVSRDRGAGAWSPLVQLGRTSLFIYWIHVELVYGVFSRPVRGSLGFGQTCVAYVVFVVFMLGCSVAKDRVAAWWLAHSRTAEPAIPTVSGSIG
jgi:uncharacterized membrane protein